eukprot:13638938-Alexandrium_andersonii.AAC.1
MFQIQGLGSDKAAPEAFRNCQKRDAGRDTSTDYAPAERWPRTVGPLNNSALGSSTYLRRVELPLATEPCKGSATTSGEGATTPWPETPGRPDLG